jgi:hypothetical protein
MAVASELRQVSDMEQFRYLTLLCLLRQHDLRLISIWYRYAWAERAKTVGYPERFAQEALGHNSKAVHRAYAKRALMKLPSLEDYEHRAAE